MKLTPPINKNNNFIQNYVFVWFKAKLFISGLENTSPANIYFFKVKNLDTRKKCEICSKLTIKTSERRRSGIFVVNIEHKSSHWGPCQKSTMKFCVKIVIGFWQKSYHYCLTGSRYSRMGQVKFKSKRPPSTNFTCSILEYFAGSLLGVVIPEV